MMFWLALLVLIVFVYLYKPCMFGATNTSCSGHKDYLSCRDATNCYWNNDTGKCKVLKQT